MNVDNYQENGCAVLRNVFTKEEVEAFRDGMIEATKIHSKEMLPDNVYQKINNAQDYSFDYWKEIPAVQAVHKIFPEIEKSLQKDIIQNSLKKIMGTENIKCIQSIFFIKSPGSKGTTWHQDELYLPTRDTSLTAVWISLSDITEENGAVDIIPKSHKPAVLFDLDEQDFDRKTSKIGKWSTEEAITLETKPGDVALFNGYTLHSSGYNVSKDKYRESIVFHLMSAESIFPYRPGDDFDGQRMDPTDFRDFFMVSGEDQYAFKGKEDLYKPFIQKPKNMYAAK